MKKIILISLLSLFAFASCQIDNYKGPDAKIHGSILDEKTGELVGTDIQNGSAIIVREQGWPNPADQTWYIKNTGEYRNDLVFAATYDVRFANGNFYPFEVKNFVVKPGDNTYDFKVTPYIRVKNASITKAGDIVTAKFKLEAGKDEVKVASVQLFAFSDMWVGNNVKFNIAGGTDKQDLTIIINKDTPDEKKVGIPIDPNTEYTLTINVKDNANVFKYKKNYYFRIGALADVKNVGTVRHNYAPYTVIAL